MKKIDNILEVLFENFNEEEIEYCILRNYQSLEKINLAEDLDISVSINSKDKAIKIFKKLNWMTPKVNLNLFSHQQFFKWNGTRLYKIDIIWGCYFSNGKYELKDKDSIYKDFEFIANIKIPNPACGLKLLVLHVVLDKGYLSNENRCQLEWLLDKNRISNDSIEYEIGQYCLNHEINLDSSHLEKKLLEKDVIENHDHLFFKFCFNLKKLKCKLRKHHYKIAIIGVDGAGKSTTVTNLKKYYGDKVATQYFGFRDYKTHFAKKMTDERTKKLKYISPLITLVALYIEMIYRFICVERKKKPIMIFDRYVWESYDNTTDKFGRLFYKLFFKIFFPKVDGVIYLYCPLEITLKRKDDIDDVNGFIDMKNRYDTIYMLNRADLSLDTSEKSQDDVLGDIVSYIFQLTDGIVC